VACRIAAKPRNVVRSDTAFVEDMGTRSLTEGKGDAIAFESRAGCRGDVSGALWPSVHET